MNTRKTSLRKLRLPSAANQERRTRSHIKNIPTISTYFQTEAENGNEDLGLTEETVCSDVMPSPIEPLEQVEDIKIETKARVGTRLSTFLLEKTNRLSNVNDFETPQKTIKKAPKTKAKSRPKRQQKIKTAFLRNEEIFSEITAQHCVADNVNPDEMQMVLALSMSEAEANGTIITNDENATTDETDNIRDKLKKFGFRTGSSEDYCLTAFLPSKKKGKWANKFTALTLRNPEKQLEKFNNRVQELLGLQFALDNLHPVESCSTYIVNSENLRKLVAEEPIIVLSDDKDRLELVDFYVLSLFEPSHTRAGHLLKDVRKIAGRDKSPKRRKTAYKVVQLKNEVDAILQSPAVKKNRYNEKEKISLTCPNAMQDDEGLVSSLPSTINVVTCDNLETLPDSVPSLNCDVSVDCDNKDPSYKLSSITEQSNSPTETLSTIDVEIPTTVVYNTNSLQSQLQFSSMRPTSPDIFGDSDIEMETDDLNVSKTTDVSSHQLTTYELFSSDEVKISSDTRLDTYSTDSVPPTIDLTQCSSDTNSQQSKEGTLSVDSLSLISAIKTAVLASNPALKELSLTMSGSESVNDLSQAKLCESIDLTQKSDDEDVLLSDDEVNYSILKANKSLYYAEIEKKVNDDDQDDDDGFGLQNVSIDRILNIGENNEISFADLIADSQPPPASPLSDFGSTSKTKSNTSLDSLDLDLSKRSDFGILEEVSPFKTPTKTPKKREKNTPTRTLSKCRKVLSDSFIASPKESSVSTHKRFSSTSKFTEFVKSNDDDSLSDLDEIDKLIYGSPSKRAYRKPSGLDQLLTGAISCAIESPKKSEPQSPKEFEFNGRTYLVHMTNVSPKPNFEEMCEVELLDRLFRYGIRPLKRKQAVKMLEYIYNQTHPCLVDVNNDMSSSQFSSISEREVNTGSVVCKQFSDHPQGIGQFNFRDCFGHHLVTEGQTLFMEIEDEQFIVQTNTSKKISTALLPFHIAWYNLIKSNKQLHEAILHYEPIDLQEVYLFFKSIGYRYDPKELKYFFDSRAIIFRYDLNKGDPSAQSNRHVRKKRFKLTQQSRR